MNILKKLSTLVIFLFHFNAILGMKIPLETVLDSITISNDEINFYHNRLLKLNGKKCLLLFRGMNFNRLGYNKQEVLEKINDGFYLKNLKSQAMENLIEEEFPPIFKGVELDEDLFKNILDSLYKYSIVSKTEKKIDYNLFDSYLNALKFYINKNSDFISVINKNSFKNKVAGLGKTYQNSYKYFQRNIYKGSPFISTTFSLKRALVYAIKNLASNKEEDKLSYTLSNGFCYFGTVEVLLIPIEDIEKLCLQYIPLLYANFPGTSSENTAYRPRVIKSDQEVLFPIFISSKYIVAQINVRVPESANITEEIDSYIFSNSFIEDHLNGSSKLIKKRIKNHYKYKFKGKNINKKRILYKNNFVMYENSLIYKIYKKLDRHNINKKYYQLYHSFVDQLIPVKFFKETRDNRMKEFKEVIKRFYGFIGIFDD